MCGRSMPNCSDKCAEVSSYSGVFYCTVFVWRQAEELPLYVSANLHFDFVGYQDVNNGKNTGKVLLGATFQTVSGTKVTLGDVKPNENFDQEGGESITVLNSTGGIKARYVYLGEGIIGSLHDDFPEIYGDLQVGWYLDDAFIAFQEWAGGGCEGEAPALVNQNSVQLENGEAVMLDPSANGGFVSAGQVAADDVEVVGDGSGKVFRCNCTPVEIELGAILPNANFDQEGGESITFLNATGGIKSRYVYLGEGIIGSLHDDFPEIYGDLQVGWYLDDAFIAFQEWAGGGCEGEPPALVNQNSLQTLIPGAGFMFSPVKNGGLIIPSAL